MKNIFSVGDYVRTLKEINFSDGSKHSFDSVHLVDEHNLAYYNTPCNSSNYKKIEPQKNSQTKIYLSEIAELASIFLDTSTSEVSPVISTRFDLGHLNQIPWPMAEVFSYNNNAFLVVEYETDGEDNFNVKTKVVNTKVWLEVIELILAEVRKETLNKLLTYI